MWLVALADSWLRRALLQPQTELARAKGSQLCRPSPYAGALLAPLKAFMETGPAQALQRTAQLLVAEARSPYLRS